MALSSLVLHQHAFLQDVAKLIIYAGTRQFIISGGELWRSPEQQKLYYDQGKSKTMNSFHLKRLAIDLNVFVMDRLATLEQIRPLGNYWESLSTLNRWGGNFTSFNDGPHFERNVP